MITKFLRFGVFILILLTALSCSPRDKTLIDEPSSLPLAGDADQVSICDLSQEFVGGEVSSTGEIVFIEPNNPDGKFAEIESGGCKTGVFVPSEKWGQWNADTQEAFQKGARVNAWGKLVSFDGQLIIVLEGIEQTIAQAEPKPAGAENDVAFELPEARESAMLDVPLIYSGSHNMPGLCYLGSAGMLVKYEHPQVDFADIIAFSGNGSSALYLNFPEMPSMLISPYMDQGIVFMANNLGADYVFAYQAGGAGSDSFQPAALPFEKNASNLLAFENSEEALDTLKRAVGSGRPVMVYLNMYDVYDDFALLSEFWRDSLEKDQASHYMVVKGYDEETIYLNDPTDPSEAAGSLTADVDNFMQAWEKTADIPNAPPLGPFWMLFLESPGQIPDAAEVVALNLERAVSAPAELRSFSDVPDDSEFTLFLLLELGNARTRFGEYLARSGQAEAGEMYKQSGALLAEMAVERAVDPELVHEAADLEEAAIALLQE